MHRTLSATLAVTLLLAPGAAAAAAPQQAQTQRLDYGSSVRCHGLLKYFADLNGEEAHPSVREGVVQTQLLARLFGEEQGKSRETSVADLAAEVARQHDRLEAMDLGQDSAVAEIGAEINQCLQLISAT